MLSSDQDSNQYSRYLSVMIYETAKSNQGKADVMSKYVVAFNTLILQQRNCLKMHNTSLKNTFFPCKS